MKKLFIFVCLIMAAASLYARAIQEDFTAAEEKARVSYAFGIAIGANLRSAEMEFDYHAFTEGVKAALGDAQAQMDEMEALEIIETAFQEAMETRNVELRIAEEEFLAENAQRPEVFVTPSGLQYEILVESDGQKPEENSLVKVLYTGTFINGNIFDITDEDEGAYIPLDMVIPGWSEGVSLMGIGSTYRFYIPSSMAYGSGGVQGIIPAYATLIFTVELLEIVTTEEDES